MGRVVLISILLHTSDFTYHILWEMESTILFTDNKILLGYCTQEGQTNKQTNTQTQGHNR